MNRKVRRKRKGTGRDRCWRDRKMEFMNNELFRVSDRGKKLFISSTICWVYSLSLCRFSNMSLRLSLRFDCLPVGLGWKLLSSHDLFIFSHHGLTKSPSLSGRRGSAKPAVINDSGTAPGSTQRGGGGGGRRRGVCGGGSMHEMMLEFLTALRPSQIKQTSDTCWATANGMRLILRMNAKRKNTGGMSQVWNCEMNLFTVWFCACPELSESWRRFA